MNKIRKNQTDVLGKRFACLFLLSVLSTGAYAALPTTDNNFSQLKGSASYGKSGNVGTLEVFNDNSVVQFSENFGIAANEVFNVVHGAGGNSGWSVLLRDVSGTQSELMGTVNLGMNLFFVNQAGVLFGQDFSVDFTATNNAAMSSAFVASTFNISDDNFAAGNYQFDAAGSSGVITVAGLRSIDGDGQVLLVSDNVSIEGQVDMPQGSISVASGNQVLAFFDNNNLLQFDITQALLTDATIDMSATGEIDSANTKLHALASDPASLVINNKGVIKAGGLSVNEKGHISLVAAGGSVSNTGTLDASSATNGDGDVQLSGLVVNLGGDSRGDSLDIEIGNAGDSALSATKVGRLVVNDSALLQFNNANVLGLGGRNLISGLANYTVNALNAGTAGYQGVGTDSWQNVGAFTFSNVSLLTARGDLSNVLTISAGGVLGEDFGGNRTGGITGGASDDTFIIAGEVEFLRGDDGNDTFIMDGGRVNTLLDGQGEIDTLRDVMNPTNIDLANGSGSSDRVANWIRVENVFEFVPPTPVPTPLTPDSPVSSIVAPQLSFLNVAERASASLGLIGDSAEPRLPCGFETRFPTVAEASAAEEEEDCLNEFATPEYQALISSLIHFDNDSSAITAASAARLDKVSDFFIRSDMFEKVVISAHTDDNASDAYNMRLSERRADSTSAYMQGQGVTGEVIETHFYGERLPAIPNTSDENRAYNRRAHIELER